MSLPVSLDDKYTLESGRIFVTGTQALVRLPMLQRERDRATGHRTAGFISGYRGSPLGGLDMQLWRAQEHLDRHDIKFLPGVNEDLAATAVWGTQQAQLSGEGTHDGVFAMWYGKGPGVDRSGDALRHGNLAGSAALGGVLLLMGDDHACESSTTCHQSEFALVDAMIPILNPAGVQDILDYGLFGWALSRYSGCWVGLKCVHDTVEASASIATGSERVRVVYPEAFEMPSEGLNIQWPDTPQRQELRLHEHKLRAALAFCRANGLNRTLLDTDRARVGIITTGKSYLDVRQALAELGIDDAAARRLGVRLHKVAMPWPLQPDDMRDFAEGLELIIVVEEKRGLIEEQLKGILYGVMSAPQIVGKHDEQGRILFPSAGRLAANTIAVEIGRRLTALHDDAVLIARLREAEQLAERQLETPVPIVRAPYFCAGCPHNTSTRVPDGSRALAGIGCHYMAQWMDRHTERFTQMGGEGASWIGEALFSQRPHIFQNIGDGTYFHSGLLAIRAAIASGVNITFKILFNDAVAMTGGQGFDGPLSVPQISLQMAAEGAKRIVVVTDEPDKYPPGTRWAPSVEITHRRRLDAVQRELREVEGTTVLIYDQTCAAEKRRRRKRGLFPDPPKRVFINEAVCEGCGDCGVKSNCVAILPVETEFGRKRRIDQSACNKDYSCLDGFCPSFVTVHGGTLRKTSGVARLAFADVPLPAPPLCSIDRNYGIVLTGVGGTGVITIGALLGMAAHIEGIGCSVLDMTGLAQKGGAVMSHIVLANRPDDLAATHVPAGGANLLLGCDMVVAAADSVLATARRGVTHAVINTFEMMTGEFTRHADTVFPAAELSARIRDAIGSERTDFVDANRLATALLGDSIGANLFMLGFAYQLGAVPISADAITRAIDLNGVSVAMNNEAFRWGRRAVLDMPKVLEASGLKADADGQSPESLDAIVTRREAYLCDYQNERYGARYRRFVERVAQTEISAAKGMRGLAEVVAGNYFKLLAYKDEYEVARLFVCPEFGAALNRKFDGDVKLRFHLAPPILARRDPFSGEPRKREFGSWILRVFRILAKGKKLRGTPFDPFGYSAERRLERRLIDDYEHTLELVLTALNNENHGLAVQIASLPDRIRGFGPVKRRHIDAAKKQQVELMDAFRNPVTAIAAA